MKNRLIILIILILIILGIFYWWQLKERKTLPREEIAPKKLPEIFNLLAEILKININDNYLIVKPLQGEWPKAEIKAILVKDTKVIELSFPFDPKNPPKEDSFSLKEEPIKIEDLKVGSRILIFTTKNIAGKIEFDDISRIQVMP